MQITINESDSFSIVSKGNVGGYDGHCLRSYSYYTEQMPDIHLVEEGTKVFKVTLDNDEVIYCTEEELRSL